MDYTSSFSLHRLDLISSKVQHTFFIELNDTTGTLHSIQIQNILLIALKYSTHSS